MSTMPIAEFADRIDAIIPVMFKAFAKRHGPAFPKEDISMPQFFILNFLYKEGQAKMKDLSSFMKVSMPAMTGIVDRMVRSGYITRTADPKDRRIVIVKIIEKGHKLAQKISHQRRQMIMNIFSKISQRDRDDYLRILMRIREALDKEAVSDKL